MTEALQEFVDSRGLSLRVDRQRGVLRGVKLIGLVSRNGRRYRDSALAEARGLYEEAKVNVNHPKDGPLAPRDYQDRLGVIRGVEFREGEGLFGDFHFNPKHPLAEQLAWDAEHNPRNVGFSHNVVARLSREGDVAVVEEITRVQSVDLVADPAATRGLYEQTDGAERWDDLTVATLELHRPDLLQELRAAAHVAEQELAAAREQVTVLQRRQRVLELLSAHGLPLAEDERGGQGAVSPAFFETLTGIDDERRLRQLVEERAALVRGAPDWRRRDSPRSRDQIGWHDQLHLTVHGAAEFAKALKQ